MKRSPWLVIAILAVLFMFGLGLLEGGSGGVWQSDSVPGSSILVLHLNGVIASGGKLLHELRKYRRDKRIKAVVLRINSPGGVVGPSQEIYAELRKTEEQYKKPVVVSCGSMAASGAFYVAMGANKVYTNPGTLMGSIGVIMEFANLQKLYAWAKVDRYAITSGPYKDAGAEYKTMTPADRELFQNLINEVLGQFKQAIATGRHMSLATVSKYADGRIFTGADAVKYGFADKIGTFSDAVHEAAQLAHISGRPHLFEPHTARSGILRFLLNDRAEAMAQPQLRDILNIRLMGKPLFLMPGQLVDFH